MKNVVKPNNTTLSRADMHRAKTWNKCLKDGIIMKKELSILMEERGVWNKTKRMSIPFFFEPSYDFKMDKSFLNGSKINNSGLIYEKFINHSLKKFVEYQR